MNAKFHSFEGNLYSGSTLIRKDFNCGFSRIKTGRQLRSALRYGPVTFPGCYPLYFVTSDGAALSFESVRENLRSVIDSIRLKCSDGWRVVACEINYEDGNLTCDHSGKRIKSAYAEDQDEAEQFID